MSQVVTELVIDSDTSAAADYERAMDGAAQAAGRATDAAMSYGTAAAAIGAGVLGVAAGVKSFLDYVADTNKGLADMQTLAQRVGLTLADFQGVKFGGAVAGLTDPQINAGLEKSAALLNDASRNANSLSKEFEANGLSIKNANGQLISQNQLLGVAADLVSRARNPQDAVAIAQMLGFTKEWIPLLQQGSAAMAGLTDEARTAGAVIDDETVNRAAEFDAQWRKSSVEFSSYMKSALLGLLPFVDDLIERAGKFVKSIDADTIERAAQDQLKGLAGQAGFEANHDQIQIGITDGAAKALEDFRNATSLLDGIVAGVNALSGSVQRVARTFPEGSDPMVGSAKASGPNNIDDVLKKWDAEQDAAQDAATAYSKVAARASEANDAVDRAINTLTRHTAQQLADSQAIGQGVGVMAEFRARAAETAAVLANGGKETEAQTAKFAALRVAASDAAIALERAKVASDIKFGASTGFLSQQDVAIASQLKGIYPNVADALNSAEAAQLRFNAAARGFSSQIENDLVTGLTDITTGTKKVGLGFSDLAVTVIKSIEQMIIKIAVVQPLMASLQSSVSASGILGFLGIGGGASAQAASASTLASNSGGAFFGPGFHDGGIVGSEPSFFRAINPAYFNDNTPRFHSGGIAGDEVPIIAKKGEGVFTQGQMAAMGGGGSVGVHMGDVNIVVQGNADDKAMAQIKTEIARLRAELPARAVDAIALAKKQRRI